MWINGCLFYLGEGVVFNPDIWDVQYSENGTDWTSATRTAKTVMGEGKVYMITTAACKYTRLVITSTTPVQIGEFQLFGFPRLNEKGAAAPFGLQYPEDLTGIITIDPVKGTFSADDPGLPAPYNEIAQNAIDGVQNKYTVNGKKMGLNFEFNEPTRVGSYSLSIGSVNNMGRNPRSMKLSAADYDMEFKVIAEVTNFTFPQVDYNCMKFNVTTPGEYVYYRIDIEGAGGESFTHISEWQLWPEQILSGLSGPVFSLELCNAYGRTKEIVINKTTSAKAHYQIIDLLGKIVKQGELKSSEIIKVNQGVYVVRVFSNELFQTTKILVK